MIKPEPRLSTLVHIANCAAHYANPPPGQTMYDLRIDESPEDIFEFAMLAEIEPQSGFGGDIRYARMVGEHFVVDAGVMGILVPSSLYGVCAGLTYRLSITKSSQVTFGPEADFFFLGTDLPDNVMLWQMRFQAGFRVDL